RRDADVEARQSKLEKDLAELEAAGAKGDARRKVRESADRECKQIRDRAQREIDRVGRYFRGGMGAQAIQERVGSFDLESEAANLREIIRTGKGQRKARALKRLKVVSAFLNTS